MNHLIIKLIGAFVLAFFIFNLGAKDNQDTSLEYYFSGTERLALNDVSKPHSVLNYNVGEWHARPEQIERYFYQLAEKSDRVKIEVYAYSHEQRPLFLAYFSSPENIRNLENIRAEHLKMSRDENRPAVTWMGYSVHGNEASGSNASMLLAYKLAASNDKETLQQLNDQIIIIDPMLNPDGLARFAHWVNMYKSKNPNSDPNTLEHNEAWPQGRTNHYWFDLNRDWLLLQHPESQGRIKMFHHWKPNVLTDFHEMGTNSTYFFQPGVPSRQNPLTSKLNFDLTAKIATYHAKALDELGSLYYSKENFDDFYYGKGSTYPDINGSIGILFEQASARGHIQESNHGLLTFPFAIKNHLATSLSTLKAVQENKKQLLNYQRDFFKKSKLNAKAKKIRAYVYTSQDKYRLEEFNRILKMHKIETYPLEKNIEVGGKHYRSENAYIVPQQQNQSSLITAIFEMRTKFKDNTFYDVSSWTMPLAFDLDFSSLTRSDFDLDLYSPNKEKTNGKIFFEEPKKNVVAISLPWSNFATANFLSYCLQNNISVRSVTKPSKFKGEKKLVNLSNGDLLVSLDKQSLSREKLYPLLLIKLQELNIQPEMIVSGLAVSGNDIGSPSIPQLNEIKPVMVVGDKVNRYQAGEVWHLLDQRLSQPLSMMTFDHLIKNHLDKYTHIILVDGNYPQDKKQIEKLKKWVQRGGVLVSQSRATKWIAKQGWTSSEEAELNIEQDTHQAYSQLSDHHSRHYIGGAIAQLNIDLSHPLSFGLDNSELAVFKRSQFSLTEPNEAFSSIARFDKNALLAGYMSKENQKNLSGKTSIVVQGIGKGKIIGFSDDMNFRGFWLGTSRVFVNALYFSDLIYAPKKTEKSSESKKK
ncbi:MAG: M14 family metallopeptidase [Kangiellaceae bacterium]